MADSAIKQVPAAAGAGQFVTSITVTGSPQAAVDFTGLDINNDGMYKIIGQVAWDQQSVGGSVADMYFNDLTTLADYVVNELISSTATNTSATFARPAFMRVSTEGSAETAGGTFELDISLNPASSIATWKSVGGVQEFAADTTWCTHLYTGRKRATLANITKITLDAAANPVTDNWAVGSLFSLYKIQTT